MPFRLTPEECVRRGDYFPARVCDGDLQFLSCIDPTDLKVIGPDHQDFYDLHWPPVWKFHRAWWRFDSIPVFLPIFIRHA